MSAAVHAVALVSPHAFSKTPVSTIRLLHGLGVEGDAHLGVTGQHRSRVARDPSQPNLRQVHPLHAELFEELVIQGFHVDAGDIGDNVSTVCVNLLGLPPGTLLCLRDSAVVELTGLRNPRVQLNRFATGLTAATLGRDAEGSLVRKAGVMVVVRWEGEVRQGEPIALTLPSEPHVALAPV